VPSPHRIQRSYLSAPPLGHLRWRAGSLAIIILLLLCSGCSRRKSASGPIPTSALALAPDLTTRPGNTFQATFTDKVVKVEQRTFLDSIQSISSDNTTFVFDPSNSITSQLKQGSILFVPGIAMRKVDVATEYQGHFVVVTENATLLEAFKDANIQWKVPVNFATELYTY